MNAAKRRQSSAQIQQTAAMRMEFAQKIVSRSEVLYRQSQAQAAKRHRQHKAKLDDAKRRASVAEKSIKNEGLTRRKLNREAEVLAAQVAPSQPASQSQEHPSNLLPRIVPWPLQ